MLRESASCYHNVIRDHVPAFTFHGQAAIRQKLNS
jgi:hypothetical protein